MTLAISDASLVYTGEAGRAVTAFENVDLVIEPGAFVVVLGASGCGKTSLLNVMAGFQRLTTGRAEFDGRPITGPGPERGVVFQKDTLFPWLDVRRNVAFGLRMRRTPAAERRARAAELLARVGLEEFAGALPHELSGGMRQRVGLARALATEPGMLLMDEPFGALDTFTRENMQELLARLWRVSRTSIFFITHSIEEALFLGTEVIVMSPRPGRILKRYRLDFVRHLSVSGDASTIRTDPRFIALREEIRALIHEPWRLRHDDALAA